MYGCCYGPFNLRNEIDRHNSTVGRHNSNTHFVTGDGGYINSNTHFVTGDGGYINSNTHFVTGDGGYINSFVSGFGGLMLGASQDALRLTKPTVPERTGEFSMEES